MDLEEHGQAATLHPGQKPQLPQRVRAIEERTENKFRRREEAALVARRSDRRGADVPLDRELGVIDPDCGTPERRWTMDDPPQLRCPRKARPQALPDQCKIQFTVCIQKRARVDETEASHVFRASLALKPQEATVSK